MKKGENHLMNYGISKTVNLSYEQAIEKVTEELKKEGFGILTTIDVKETMKLKLDKDVDKYIILGACNPPFAYESLHGRRTNRIAFTLQRNRV